MSRDKRLQMTISLDEAILSGSSCTQIIHEQNSLLTQASHGLKLNHL